MKIRDLFDRCATTYDRDRRVLVPCFDDFYGTVLRVIPFADAARIRVLDLGAGTGLLAAMIAGAFPFARIHLTDVSEAMLGQARQRFAGNPRVTFAVQDHSQLTADAEYDLVLSALSIHHLENSAKQTLFGQVYRALRRGGMFINADQALGPFPEGEEAYHSQWLAAVKAGGLSEPAWEQAMARVAQDRNATLADQLAWLAGAGFDKIDCWYKWFRFVVYGGVRV